MSEPTSALSFYDLILRVARESGMAYHGSDGTEPGMIPADDYHDFELCKQIVNDAIRMFISDAPPKGWRWMRRIASVTMASVRTAGTVDSVGGTAPGPYTLVDATLEEAHEDDDDLNGYWIYILTGTGAGNYAQITDYTASGGTVTVADWLDEYGNAVGNTGGAVPVAADTFAITDVETVEGDLARYPLPEDFGGEVNGQIKYASSSGHGIDINWVDESLIRQRRQSTVVTSYPNMAATRPLEYKSGGFGPKRRWEIIFDPQPSGGYTVEFPYTLHFDELRMVAGLASAGDSTSLTDSSFANYYPIDYFNDTWKVFIISGTGRNNRAAITDFTGTTFKVDVAKWLAIDDSTTSAVNAASGDAYYLEPLANLHPAGLRFDQAILAACLMQAELQVEEVAGNYVNKYTKKALPQAWKIDTRSGPRTLGSMDRHKRYRYDRTWTDITTDVDM